MPLDLQQILGVLLPMVKDDSRQEAEQVITGSLAPQPVSQGANILGALTSLIGGQPSQPQAPGGAGLNLAGLAKAAPLLLSMIKPEHVEDVISYIGDAVAGKIKGSKSGKSTKKSTATKTTKKTTTTAAKKSTPAKKATTKASTAKKTTPAKKTTTKKPAAKKATSTKKK